MNDSSFYSPERSIALYAAAGREHEAAANERTMTVWAVIALAIVLVTLTIGGCA